MKAFFISVSLWIAAFFGIILAQGCSFQCYPPQPIGGTSGPKPPVTPTDPKPVEQVITYTQVASTILVPICGGCHGTAGGYSFQSYDGTMKAVEAGDPDNSQLCYQVRNGLMPQGKPPLSADQVNLVCNWILQGAKNN